MAGMPIGMKSSGKGKAKASKKMAGKGPVGKTPPIASTPAPFGAAGGSGPVGMTPPIAPSAAGKGLMMPSKKTMASMKSSLGSMGSF